MEKKYRHIGYYNNIEDILALKDMNPTEMLDYFKNTNSNFFATSEFPEMTEKEINEKIGNLFGVDIFKIDKYIITKDTDNNEWENFIDFYEEIK